VQIPQPHEPSRLLQPQRPVPAFWMMELMDGMGASRPGRWPRIPQPLRCSQERSR
jgi:hypothetical protein